MGMGWSAWIDVEHATSSSRTSDDEALHRLRKVAFQKAGLVQRKLKGWQQKANFQTIHTFAKDLPTISEYQPYIRYVSVLFMDIHWQFITSRQPFTIKLFNMYKTIYILATLWTTRSLSFHHTVSVFQAESVGSGWLGGVYSCVTSCGHGSLVTQRSKDPRSASSEVQGYPSRFAAEKTSQSKTNKWKTAFSQNQQIL